MRQDGSRPQLESLSGLQPTLCSQTMGVKGGEHATLDQLWHWRRRVASASWYRIDEHFLAAVEKRPSSSLAVPDVLVWCHYWLREDGKTGDEMQASPRAVINGCDDGSSPRFCFTLLVQVDSRVHTGGELPWRTRLVGRELCKYVGRSG
jgi:hypothetical protein